MQMRTRRAVLVFAFVAICELASRTLAEPVGGQAMRVPAPIPANTWEGWRFAVPAGWQAQPTPEAMVLTPPGGGTSRVRLLAPQAVSGQFGPWFAKAAAAQASGLRGFRLGGPVKAARTTGGAPTLYVTGQGTSLAGQRVVASYMGMLSENGEGLLMVAEFDRGLDVFRADEVSCPGRHRAVTRRPRG